MIHPIRAWRERRIWTKIQYKMRMSKRPAELSDADQQAMNRLMNIIALHRTAEMAGDANMPALRASLRTRVRQEFEALNDLRDTTHP